METEFRIIIIVLAADGRWPPAANFTLVVFVVLLII